jgi:signal transduction histidine kinase
MKDTVTFKLTVLFMLLFSVLSLALFIIVQNRLSVNLMKNIDNDLLKYSNEMVPFIVRNLRDKDDIRRRIRQDMGSEATRRKRFLVFLSKNQEEIITSELSDWRGIPFKFAELDSLNRNDEIYKTLPVPGRNHHVRVIYEKSDDGMILETGFLLDDYEDFMFAYQKIYWIVFSILFLVGGFFGYVLARRAMAGVERVTKTAAQIGHGDLSSRVAVGKEGLEIEQLANAFNDMLERIQKLVFEIKEVTNNIAHDLRSPVTRIRGISETTLTGSADIGDYQEMGGVIIEECDRLIEMINTMLEIAMTDSGVKEYEVTDIDMIELAKNAYELFSPVAEDKGIEMTFTAPEKQLFSTGNEQRLQRSIANILDNAIKFTPNGGKVTLDIFENNEEIHIELSDTGVGISSENISHIFDRFYREEKSRSETGNGLGLSLAHSIIHAHGGKIFVSSEKSKGSSFTIILPLKHYSPQNHITEK